MESSQCKHLRELQETEELAWSCFHVGEFTQVSPSAPDCNGAKNARVAMLHKLQAAACSGNLCLGMVHFHPVGWHHLPAKHFCSFAAMNRRRVMLRPLGQSIKACARQNKAARSSITPAPVQCMYSIYCQLWKARCLLAAVRRRNSAKGGIRLKGPRAVTFPGHSKTGEIPMSTCSIDLRHWLPRPYQRVS